MCNCNCQGGDAAASGPLSTMPCIVRYAIELVAIYYQYHQCVTSGAPINECNQQFQERMQQFTLRFIDCVLRELNQPSP